MLAEVDDNPLLADKDIKRDSSAGMEDRVEAQSLFISEMVGFDVGGERIGTVRTVVKIEIYDA